MQFTTRPSYLIQNSSVTMPATNADTQIFKHFPLG